MKTELKQMLIDVMVNNGYEVDDLNYILTGASEVDIMMMLDNMGVEL